MCCLACRLQVRSKCLVELGQHQRPQAGLGVGAQPVPIPEHHLGAVLRARVRRSGDRPVDPAAASFKVQLGDDGVSNIINGDNNVLYGIQTMASLLSENQLLVSDRCAGFINEAPGYSWDPKATEKGEDKPLKVADHSLDAARYAIITTETNWRRYLGGKSA